MQKQTRPHSWTDRIVQLATVNVAGATTCCLIAFTAAGSPVQETIVSACATALAHFVPSATFAILAGCNQRRPGVSRLIAGVLFSVLLLSLPVYLQVITDFRPYSFLAFVVVPFYQSVVGAGLSVGIIIYCLTSCPPVMQDELPTRECVDSLPMDCGDLLIRRVRHTDFADMRAIYSDPDVARYQEWEPMSDEQVAEILEGQGSVLPGDPGIALILPVELKAENRAIGDVLLTITSPDDRQAELGFCFHPAYHGRGYASRAVNAVLGYAFHKLEMHRIQARCDVRNERSWRLLERVGMRREGHLRQCAFLKGEWIDDYVYAMLASEWSPEFPTNPIHEN